MREHLPSTAGLVIRGAPRLFLRDFSFFLHTAQEVIFSHIAENAAVTASGTGAPSVIVLAAAGGVFLTATTAGMTRTRAVTKHAGRDAGAGTAPLAAKLLS